MAEFGPAEFRRSTPELSEHHLAPLDIGGAFLDELYRNGWGGKQGRLFRVIISNNRLRESLLADINRDLELAPPEEYWRLAEVLLEGALSSSQFRVGMKQVLESGSSESKQRRDFISNVTDIIDVDASGQIIALGFPGLCAEILSHPDMYSPPTDKILEIVRDACDDCSYFRQSLVYALQERIRLGAEGTLAGSISALREVLCFESCGEEEAKALQVVVMRFNPRDEEVSEVICSMFGVLAIETPMFTKKLIELHAPDQLLDGFEDASPKLREDISEAILDLIEGSCDDEMLYELLDSVVRSLFVLSRESRSEYLPLFQSILSLHEATPRVLVEVFADLIVTARDPQCLEALLSAFRCLMSNDRIWEPLRKIRFHEKVEALLNDPRWDEDEDIGFLLNATLGSLHAMPGGAE